MIVSPGTKIVTKVPIAGTHNAYTEGCVAVVVETPADASHSWRVRMTDGFESNLTPDQFVLLKTMQEAQISEEQARTRKASAAW